MMNPNVIGDVPHNPRDDFALESATEARAGMKAIGFVMIAAIVFLICIAVGLIAYARGIDREQGRAEQRLRATIESNGTIEFKDGTRFTCAWYRVEK